LVPGFSRLQPYVTGFFPAGEPLTGWARLQAKFENISFLFLVLSVLTLPLGTSPFTVCGGAGLFFWLISHRTVDRYAPLLREPWIAPLAAWIGIHWVGLLYSPDPRVYGMDFALKTHYWVYAVAIGTLVSKKFPADRIIHALLAGLILNSIVACLQIGGIWPVDALDPKYLGLTSGYNSLAVFLNAGILIASYYFRWRKRMRSKAYFLIIIALFIFSIALTRGRSGYLTLLLILPIVIYNIMNGKRLLIAFLLCLLVCGLISYSPFVQERVTETLVDIQARLRMKNEMAWGEKYSEMEDRVYMWYWAVKMFAKNPVFGVGTGGYDQTMKQGGAEVVMPHPHSNYLHVASNFGLLGISIFVWLFYVLLRRGWIHRRDPVGYFVLSGILVFLIGGLNDTHLLDAGTAFFLAVLTGLQTALPKRSAGALDIQ
jgi:O-antigen ligase